MLSQLYGLDTFHDSSIPSSYFPTSIMWRIIGYSKLFSNRFKTINDLQFTEAFRSSPRLRLSSHINWRTNKIFWLGESQWACRV